MKILLINPPGKVSFISPPLGLLYIASSLKKAGHKVAVIDYNMEPLDEKKLLAQIRRDKIKAVGISIVTPKVYDSMKLADFIRKNLPKTILIAGGPHATLAPQKLMEDCPSFDFVVQGEGEIRMANLTNSLEKKSPIDNLDGLAFRKNGKITVNLTKGFIENMDVLSMPARELIDIDRYGSHMKTRFSPSTTMMTSRGCPYQCIYCSKPVTGLKMRAISPQKVIKEIEFLVSRYGIKEIIFYDDSFTLIRDRAVEICNLILQKNIKVQWQCETRVNLVDEELLKLMKKAGCYSIAYGLESGSDRVLKILKKGVTTEQMIKAIALTKRAGIEVIGYFMLGIPGETEAEIKQTINFAKKINPDYAQFSIATAYPGTELYQIAQSQNKITDDWSKSIYALGGKPLVSLSNVPIDTLYKYVKKAYRSFYFRPMYVWQKIKSLRSPKDLLYNLKGLKALLKI